jgi:hypothetical protein
MIDQQRHRLRVFQDLVNAHFSRNRGGEFAHPYAPALLREAKTQLLDALVRQAYHVGVAGAQRLKVCKREKLKGEWGQLFGAISVIQNHNVKIETHAFEIPAMSLQIVAPYRSTRPVTNGISEMCHPEVGRGTQHLGDARQAAVGLSDAVRCSSCWRTARFPCYLAQSGT